MGLRCTLPALYCVTLWFVCFLQSLPLQYVRRVFGMFTWRGRWSANVVFPPQSICNFGYPPALGELHHSSFHFRDACVIAVSCFKHFSYALVLQTGRPQASLPLCLSSTLFLIDPALLSQASAGESQCIGIQLQFHLLTILAVFSGCCVCSQGCWRYCDV
jgi:hypothetical protein